MATENDKVTLTAVEYAKLQHLFNTAITVELHDHSGTFTPNELGAIKRGLNGSSRIEVRTGTHGVLRYVEGDKS